MVSITLTFCTTAKNVTDGHVISSYPTRTALHVITDSIIDIQKSRFITIYVRKHNNYDTL
jgi:hypothetical protein